MIKYPIKHTMEFERKTECNSECGMRMKYSISCGQHNCEHLKVSVTFDLIKECPECWGKGKRHVQYVSGNESCAYVESCPHCSNNVLPAGKVHRYWTMQKATEKMGEGWEWPEDTVIWLLTLDYDNNPIWEPARYMGLIHEAGRLGSVLAFPLQPAPPADYRPDEN